MEQDAKDLDIVLSKENFIKNLFEKLLGVATSANQLPDKDEITYYKKNPAINEKLRNINHQLVNNIEKINLFSNQKTKIDLKKGNITIKYNDIVETLDGLLENVDSILDKINKKSDKKISIMNESNDVSAINKLAQDIPKPQLVYGINDFDNDVEKCFIPKIKEKLHSQFELNPLVLEAHQNPELFFKKFPKYEFLNPYKEDIENLALSSDQLRMNFECELYKKFEKDKFTYVEDEPTLEKMISILENVTEIAVDLEHNHLRSFQGFTCLVQISTRNEDFIVDPFKIWRSMQKLNSVFTNPHIVKVLHGADNDVMWLQRDFGVYIVNMFDTGQASRALKFESFSFAFLLSYYCDIHVSKAYQLADWRIRPLSKEMIKYAREDVHYLLYIYDRMRKDLMTKAVQCGFDPLQYMLSVVNKSKEICSRNYVKPNLKDENYYNIMVRNKEILSKLKIKKLKALLKLRFQIGAEEDDNPNFILPNNLVFQLVDKSPKTEKQLLNLVKKPNPILKKIIPEILKLLAEDKSNEEDSRQLEPNQKMEFEALELNESKPSSSLIKIDTLQNNFDNLGFSENFSENDQKIILKKFDNSISTFSHSNTNKSSLSQIKDSFHYSHYSQYLCEIYPEIKKLFSESQKNQELAKNSTAKLNFYAPKDEKKPIEEKNPIEFISFSEEKGPAPEPSQKDKNKTIRLPLQKVAKDVIPPSLKEQYEVNLKKRKMVNKGNEGQVVKKQKTRNQFEVLEEGEEATSINMKEIEEKFKEISKKINENMSHKVIDKKQKKRQQEDPDIIEKIAEKNDGKFDKKKKRTTKFGDQKKTFSLKEL